MDFRTANEYRLYILITKTVHYSAKFHVCDILMTLGFKFQLKQETGVGRVSAQYH